MKKHIFLIASILYVMNAVSTKAQTITAPTGQNLTIANSVNVTGGSVNIKADSSYKIGGVSVVKTKNSSIYIGAKAANANPTGDFSVYLGTNSGYSNTSGTYQVFVGPNAGYSNTTGSFNSFYGPNAGYSNTTGSNNFFSGLNAGYFNTIGELNFFLGSAAGYSNTTGSYNSFLGADAGRANTTGSFNMFIGANAGTSNLTGNNNFFAGLNVGYNNTTGSYNTFSGSTSGYSNTLGSYNNFSGAYAGRLNTTGNYNNFYGANAGYSNTTGEFNTSVGVNAGYSNVTGHSNTYLGYNAQGTASLSNTTAIGANASVTASNSVVLGNNANVGIGTTAPANKLEVVAAAGQSGLRLKGLAGMSGTLQVNAAGDVILVGAGARMAAATDDANWTLSSNYLYNNSNGVVIGEGISSLPAGYKLFVSDGILTEKVKVAVKNEEDWADRVFEDNYKMLSLAQTNQYIKENKHLPGVPSTQEMIEKGNDLHKTDVILLTKIEELYRHVIKIEQENQALKKELKSLKNRKR